MSDRVQLTFDSPADAAINPKVRIKYGEIRNNVHMYGAFCISKIEAGEFICAWNGFQVIDDDKVDHFTNIYDLTKYVISFPGKRGQKIFSCVRLDNHGKPKLPGTATDDPRDISLAVFLNEPADNEYALYDIRKDSISRFPKSRNSANVCLKTQPQRKLGIVCPLMFASRDINVGEELVWDYGELYDRKIYEIDEDNKIFNVGMEYKENIPNSNDCKVTCWTVEFRNKLPIEEFTPNLFLLDKNISAYDMQRIKFRSQKYLWDFSDTESTVTDALEERPIKKRKKKQKLKIHSVEYTDVHKQDIDDFIKMQKNLNQKADLICAQIQNLKITGKTNPRKKEFIEMVKNIFLHSVWREYSYIHPQTSKYVTQFFIRPDFCLTKSTVETFVNAGDSHWKDIMIMQYKFLQSIEHMCDKREYFAESIEPNTFARMFKSLTGVVESISDWQEESFAESFPNASRIAIAFFEKLIHISNIVDHYLKWKSIHNNIILNRMKSCVKKSNSVNSIDTTIHLKIDELCKIGISVLQRNSYEIIIEEWIYELIFKLLLNCEAYLEKTCISGTRAIDDFISNIKSTFDTFETRPSLTKEYLDNHDTFQALKEICNYKLTWRAESMLSSLNKMFNHRHV